MKNFVLLLLTCFVAFPASSTIIRVTTNANSGPGSFREAIGRASSNGTLDVDTVVFDLPDLTENGRTIRILAALPPLSSRLIIDGSTQAGTPFGISDAKVRITFNGNTNSRLLTINLLNNVQVYGLFIKSESAAAAGAAFQMAESHDIIIGAPGKGNVFNNLDNGITTPNGSGIVNLTIQSNFWGLSPDGTNGGAGFMNLTSLPVESVKNVTIGGRNPAEGNFFCDRSASVKMYYSYQVGGKILIANNSFNVNHAGDRSTNSPVAYQAVFIAGQFSNSSTDSVIFESNHFGGLRGQGLYYGGKTPIYIKKNVFGVNKATNEMIVDDFFRAIEIFGCDSAYIGGSAADKNIMGFGRTAVRLTDCRGGTVSQNSMFCNDGIDRQYFFTWTQAYIDIERAEPNYIAGGAKPFSKIELFESDSCDKCVGMNYQTSFMADALGRWEYTGPLPARFVLTATDTYGATSAFSRTIIRNPTGSVRPSTCGRSNGSIRNLQTRNATWWRWTDEFGNIVGTDSVLLNVGVGKYRLEAGYIGANCTVVSPEYILTNVDVSAVNTAPVQVTQPTCHLPNGRINYTGTLPTGVVCWLKNDAGTVVRWNSLDFTNLAPGNYVMAWGLTMDTTCNVLRSFQLVNSSGPSLDLSAIVNNSASCGLSNGSIMGITANNVAGTGVYVWVDASNRTVGNSANLENMPAGSYRLKFKDAAACDTLVTPLYTIVDNTVPVKLGATSVSLRDESCNAKNGFVEINSFNMPTTGFNFSWVDASNNQAFSTALRIEQLSAGTYELYATDANGCRQLVTTSRLASFQPPAIDASSAVISNDICTQQIGSIKNLTVNGAGPFSYTWYDAKGTVGTNATTLENIGEGVYHLVVEDRFQCQTTSTPFTINNTIAAVIPPQYDNPVVVRGQPATLQLKNYVHGIYTLYASSVASDATEQNGSGIFKTGVLYQDTLVYVHLQQGTCAGVRTPVSIKVLQSIDLVMPNAFTPNNDGKNDVFRVKYTGFVRKIQMDVYNRWGQRIFTSVDPSKGWDGTLNGMMQPEGSYAWAIVYEDVLGAQKKVTGQILLIR